MNAFQEAFHHFSTNSLKKAEHVWVAAHFLESDWIKKTLALFVAFIISLLFTINLRIQSDHFWSQRLLATILMIPIDISM